MRDGDSIGESSHSRFQLEMRFWTIKSSLISFGMIHAIAKRRFAAVTQSPAA
jgi:hypothetical protein